MLKKWGQTIVSFSTKVQQNKRQFAGLSGDVLSHFVIKYMSVVYQNDVQTQQAVNTHILQTETSKCHSDGWFLMIYNLFPLIN